MATFAQMRTPLRIILRCSGVHVAGGQTGESSGLFPSFSLLVSFMLPSHSGDSSGRWPLVTGLGTGRPARTEWGRAPSGISCWPRRAAVALRLRPAGPRV